MRHFFFFFLFIPVMVVAQATLKPSVGLPAMPDDSASICSIPTYTGNFETTGLQQGDTAYDFTLYSLSSDSFSLSEKLSRGKPVLLVSGSYTCPVFRNKMAVLNSVVTAYAGQIEVAVIYTVEAHPTNISPYFGYVNITQANQNAGILYNQPQTYAERKSICSDLVQQMSMSAPVFLDGPCNEWWNIYGPAPNNAYLIDTNGIVFAKHGWFDRRPDHNIVCDIDSLMGNGSCVSTPATGAFALQPVSQTVSGLPGEVLYAHVNVINTTGNYVKLGVKKQQPNLPASWETAFCFQVCFSPSEDSITIEVAPYDTADLSLDFFTDSSTPDSGSMKVGFRNTYDVSNAYSMTFRAFTTQLPNGVVNPIGGDVRFSIFPNPSKGKVQLLLPEAGDGSEAEVFDTYGRVMYRQMLGRLLNTLSLEHLADGIYFVRVGSTVRKWVKE